jgi:predicted TIM-barrel fold metal-dependent hydrolase
MNAIPIFDVDTHFTEPADLWTSRAPSKYKDNILNVRKNKAGAMNWYVGDKSLGLIGATVIDRDMKKHYGVLTMSNYDEVSRAGTYAKERLAYMDDAGVGTQLVYANVIGFGGQALMTATDDAELRLWHVRTYNDAIYDLQKDSGGRILPQAALPLWDIDESIIELNRARKLGLSGIAMSNTPAHFGQPPLAHPKWDRFFATCQDLDLPINFHVGSGLWAGDFAKWWGEDTVPVREDGSVNSPMVIWSSAVLQTGNIGDVANMIMSGLLEKYPKLKFVSVESGCGWVAALIQALEHNWGEIMSKEYLAKFKRSPKQQFMDQVYCTYWLENSTCVDSFVKEFGSKNLMFETDFPHPVSLYPNDIVRDKIAESLKNCTQSQKEDILYKNAERVYGIKCHQVSAKAA